MPPCVQTVLKVSEPVACPLIKLTLLTHTISPCGHGRVHCGVLRTNLTGHSTRLRILSTYVHSMDPNGKPFTSHWRSEKSRSRPGTCVCFPSVRRRPCMIGRPFLQETCRNGFSCNQRMRSFSEKTHAKRGTYHRFRAANDMTRKTENDDLLSKRFQTVALALAFRNSSCFCQQGMFMASSKHMLCHHMLTWLAM